MPRYRRILVPGIPLHIVQRGHDKQPTFIEPDDYQLYLNNLMEQRVVQGVKVYGYCLMTNHVHLILEPGDPCRHNIRIDADPRGSADSACKQT